MTYPISRHEQEVSVGALSHYTLPLGNADYIRFHTVPAGVLVRLNGGSAGTFIQGETHQAEPGSGELREVSFHNTTGGALAVRVIFGLGRIEVTGVATISGALPLPSGAATEAKQDTQTTRLNLLATEAKQDTQITRLNLLATEAKQDTQITRLNLLATEAKQDTQITRLNLLATEAKQDTQITRLNLLGTEVTLAALLAAVATATKQDAQTALLTTLAANVAVTGDVVTITGSQAFANCRALSVANTGAANITVNNGAGARTLLPGDSVEWPCVGPFAKYGTITVDATGSSAVVVTTV